MPNIKWILSEKRVPNMNPDEILEIIPHINWNGSKATNNCCYQSIKETLTSSKQRQQQYNRTEMKRRKKLEDKLKNASNQARTELVIKYMEKQTLRLHDFMDIDKVSYFSPQLDVSVKDGCYHKFYVKFDQSITDMINNLYFGLLHHK
eukprot:230899_1